MFPALLPPKSPTRKTSRKFHPMKVFGNDFGKVPLPDEADKTLHCVAGFPALHAINRFIFQQK